MAVQAVVQRRVDAAAAAWARAFPDPQLPDPVLRTAVHRFADETAPALLPPAARTQPAAVLGLSALALAVLALVALLLPHAAVPLLVLGALVLLGTAWSAAGRRDGPGLEELRGALRSAAYGGLLARRADERAGNGPRPPAWSGPVGSAVARLDHAALQGRATYAAAAALDTDDTATVIDL